VFVLTSKDLTKREESTSTPCRVAFPEAESGGTIDQQLERVYLPDSGGCLKYRILVVEDNQLNRELLCDWLEVEATKSGLRQT